MCKIIMLVIVYVFQMCVLMLFNTRERMTYEDIQQETDIPSKDLIRALQSLSMGKQQQRLLVRMPKTSKEIVSTDEFSVNDAFVSKFHKYVCHTVIEEVVCIRDFAWLILPN